MASNRGEYQPHPARASLVISPHKAKEPESRPIPKWQIATVASVLGLALAVVLGLVLFRFYMIHSVQAHVHKLQAAGVPSSTQELLDWYMEGSSSENSGSLLLDAVDQLPADARGELTRIVFLDRSFSWPQGPIDPDLRKAAQQALEEASTFRAQLHEATREGLHYQFSTWYDRDYSFQFGGWTSSARYLLAESVLAAEAGDEAGAVDSLFSLFRMAESLKREPISSGQRRRQATLHLFIDGVEQVMSRLDLSAASLKNLDEALATPKIRDSAIFVLRGERATSLSSNRWKLLYDEAGERTWMDQLAGPSRLTLQYLELMEQLEGIIALDAKASREAWQKMMNDDQSAANSLLDRHMFSPFVYQMMEGRLLSARTAVAIESFRRQKGVLPTSLDELVPEYLAALPVDPFTGEPLLYRQGNGHFSVYSVGYNATDEQGETLVLSQEGTRQHVPPPMDSGVKIFKS